MTENNAAQTSIYTQALTEAKYLVNSGKLNPEPAKHLIHLRQQLRDKLRESCSLDRFDPRREEDCKTALEELQKAIKEIAPHGWDFHQVQMEIYKAVRGEDYMREFDNNWVEGETKPKSNRARILVEYKADSDMTYVFGENMDVEDKPIAGSRILLREYQGDNVKNVEAWFTENAPRLFGNEVTFETPKH